jgi:putative restriction endonuclease
VWLAWETFGEANGCATQAEMQRRLDDIRKGFGYEPGEGDDRIGCTLLVQPTFFPPEAWIPQPSDWKVRTQSSTRYDLSRGEGARVWQACLAAAAGIPSDPLRSDAGADRELARYGEPILVRPRLGQRTFRIAVTDAYGRACAISGEHSLPALQASHIQPFGRGGDHRVSNGLLLRADLHRLFDLGYVTVDEKRRVVVSERLRNEYHNGRAYYPFHGHDLQLPKAPRDHPDPALLRWHNENVFAA